MNKTTIETSIAIALRCNWSPTKLGHELAGPPYNLTPPEATIIMDEYRRRYPKAGADAKAIIAKLQTTGAQRQKKNARIFDAFHKDQGPYTAEQLRQTPPPSESAPSTARPSIINRSAVKSFALKVSKEKRAGKFNRVSKEFLDSVEANLEALIREIAQGFSTAANTVVPDADCDWFINGRTLRCAEDKLNQAVQKIIIAKVHGHPSIGKTLK